MVNIKLFIFLFSIGIRFLYLYITGIHLGGDTVFYDTNAVTLLAAHFNPASLLQAQVPPYYWLYPYFMAITFNLHTAIIALQIILQGFAAVLLFATANKIFNKKTGFIAGIFYALFFEVFQWDTYILTDSLYMFFITLLLFLVTKLTFEPKKSTYVYLAITIFCMAFLRPTSLPLFIALAIYGIYRFRNQKKILYAAFIFLIILGIITAYKLNLFNPTQGFGITSYMHYFNSLFERGIVLRDRPYYSLPVYWTENFSWHNSVTFLNIFIHKLIAFWYITVNTYSPAHKILNILFLVPLYFFSILGNFFTKQSAQKNALRIFLLATIISVWIFHALTEVDYDFRYRLPVWPAIILFASYGLFSCLTQKTKALQ